MSFSRSAQGVHDYRSTWTEEQWDKHRLQIRTLMKAAYNRTLTEATRNGLAWTRNEDKIVLDDSISNEDTAVLLNRTLFAVQNRKYRLQHDLARPELARDREDIVPKRVQAPLCACGDEAEHASWCPGNEEKANG